MTNTDLELSSDNASDDEEELPLLFVDVDIGGGKTDRVIVYQDNSAEDLAKEFAQKHSLNSEMEARLVNLLNQQITDILIRMEQ